MKIIDRTTDIHPESRFDLDSVLFFDIETTGLSKEVSYVYLIGCAYKEAKNWVIKQFLAEHIREERQLVEAFYEVAQKYHTLVHFNGLHFDVPYMDHKAEEYGLSFRLCLMEQYDILLKARKARTLLGMGKMSQKAVEAYLKIRRDDEMSGGELIPFYFEYQNTGDARLEKYLLLHNYDDMQGMLKISPFVAYADLAEGRFHVTGIETEIGGSGGTQETITISMEPESALPRAFEKSGPQYLLAGSDRLLQLVLTPVRTEACFYFEDYKNYYYLPDEDRAIHKDLAQFVDKANRVKATKKTCYVKKQSDFLPQRGELFSPCFKIPDVKDRTFFESSVLFQADEEQIRRYVLEFFRK